MRNTLLKQSSFSDCFYNSPVRAAWSPTRAALFISVSSKSWNYCYCMMAIN
ncbi:hypothetical protein CsSME_00000620 [Camellia sinensis var. sinensis]